MKTTIPDHLLNDPAVAREPSYAEQCAATCHELPKEKSTGHKMALEIERLKAEKAELITALESILDAGNRSFDEYVRLYGFSERAADDNARAVIERAKG